MFGIEDDYDKILLIEDDGVDRIAFERLVIKEELHYRYRITASLKEARAALQDERFDIIVSDYNLGDGTALDIMGQSAGSPIIIITGAGNEEVAIKAIRGGAYDYIVKDHDRNYLKLLPVSIATAIAHNRDRQRLQLLEEAVMNANDAIIILEAEPTNLPGRKVLYVNEAFTKMTGYHRDNILGKTLNMLTGPNTDREALSRISKAFDERNPTMEEVINYKRDGTPFWVESNIVPFANEKGWTVHWVSIQRDITERKMVERALQKAKEAAEDASRSKSDFLSTVSHELRTPLTSIHGFATVTKKKLEEVVFPTIESADKKVLKTIEQVKGNFEIMLDETQRLTALINDVLDIAKIEAGKIDWKEDDVDLADVFLRAEASCSTLFASKNLFIKSMIEDRDYIITGDRDALIQVVTNLFSNAVKFTESGGITYRLSKGKDVIRCEVSDTGIGIPHDMLDVIFDRFKQIGDTLTNKPKGTGLGLAICKEIIGHHRGRIWAQANMGQGSTFVFELPQREAM